MPRIDPIQLLNCLSVLLSPNGGIKSKDEVQRLASLMTKFSKKLVSKCIYIQILKYTEMELLGLFMGAGGWTLTHMWLTESIVAKNWPLVQELLELLLLCPVDLERLKTNNCPKLVKELSKDGTRAAIRVLAAKLVDQWLKIVKGEATVTPVTLEEIPSILNTVTSTTPSNDTVVKNESISEPIETTSDLKSTNEVIKNVVKVEVENSEKVESNATPQYAEVSGSKNITSKRNSSDKDESSVNDEESEKEMEALPILKITVKDGKQVISKVQDPSAVKKPVDEDKTSNNKEKMHKINKSKDKSKDKDKSSNSKASSPSKRSSSSSSSGKHSSKSSSESSDKHRSSSSSNKHKDKRDKSKDSSHNSSNSSSKDKDKHRDKKYKHSSSRDDKKARDDNKMSNNDSNQRSEKIKSSKSSKDEKSKVKDQNEKNKETLEKLQPPSIHKLGKIPKKSVDHVDIKKESPSISIEVRKPNDPNRPKTVKMFNSKFRSHGLEEEAKPPPPRGSVVKKPPPAIPPTVSIPKRHSPVHSHDAPPEKKLKGSEHVDKPGAIKLIPAKPKPTYLLESDMFMDALTASATNKKEPKKRKRRTSGSKDGNPANEGSPPHNSSAAGSSPACSPTAESKPTPPRFYKDTLDTEDDKDAVKRSPNDKEDSISSPKSPKEEEKQEEELVKVKSEEEVVEKVEKVEKLEAVVEEKEEKEVEARTLNGLRSVLSIHKRKGPKKSIRWRPEGELEQIQYFELDENERVNVTKTSFIDMKHLDLEREREAFQKGRNILNKDTMEEKMSWRPLIPIDTDAPVVEYGKNSKEKDIQAARQRGILQNLYFHKSMIPDSGAEPDVESHPMTDPAIIPLDDVTGNPDSVNDFRNTPWPEPKQNPQHSSSGLPETAKSLFPTMPAFPNVFPNTPFGVPGFQGPGPLMGPGGDWAGNMPPPNIQSGPIPPVNMPPGNMPPGNMPPGNMPPGNMMPGMMMPPDMFGGPGPMFPGPMPPVDGFGPMMDNMNGPPQMFPPGFPGNMPSGGPIGPSGPGGSSGPNGPPNSFGFNNNRGAMRSGGPRGPNSHSWRNKGPGSWDGPSRGRGGRRVCTHFQKSYCRQGDKCAFLHPGVNCPY